MRKIALCIIALLVLSLLSCANRFALKKEAVDSAPRIDNFKVVHLGRRDAKMVVEFNNVVDGIKSSHLNVAIFAQDGEETDMIPMGSIELKEIGYNAYDKITSGILELTIFDFITDGFEEVNCEIEIWIVDKSGGDSNRKRYKFKVARQMSVKIIQGLGLTRAFFCFDFFVF